METEQRTEKLYAIGEKRGKSRNTKIWREKAREIG